MRLVSSQFPREIQQRSHKGTGTKDKRRPNQTCWEMAALGVLRSRAGSLVTRVLNNPLCYKTIHRQTRWYHITRNLLAGICLLLKPESSIVLMCRDFHVSRLLRYSYTL